MAAISAKTLQPFRLIFPSSSKEFLFHSHPIPHLHFSKPPPITTVRSRNSSAPMIPRKSRLVRASSSMSELSNASGVLSDIEIFRANGEPVKFKDLWDQNEGVAVVALMRHFGCICCWEFASALKELIPRFDAAGVKLIAVGVGTPNKAQILVERLPFPMDYLYADPERKAYDALGLYFGVGRTFFNPASVKVFSRFEALKKAAENYTIEATPDDRSSVLQQGGMLIFKGKQLFYARKEEGTGDHPSLDDIFDVCCKMPVA